MHCGDTILTREEAEHFLLEDGYPKGSPEFSREFRRRYAPASDDPSAEGFVENSSWDGDRRQYAGKPAVDL